MIFYLSTMSYLYKTFQIFLYKVNDFYFEDGRQNKSTYKTDRMSQYFKT